MSTSDKKPLKLTAEFAEFKKHLLFVRNGLGASKTDLPVMLIRCEVDGQRLTMFASNKELFCRTEMKITRPDGDEARSGSFAVLGGKLEQLTSAIEAESLSLSADDENLQIQVGFLTVNLEIYDEATLRTVEQGVREHLGMEGPTVPTAALAEALGCARSCATANSIRPDITHAELRDGKMLSSDGRKIMIYAHPLFPAGTNALLKVPVSSLADVHGAVKHCDAEAVQLIEGKSYFYLKGGKSKFTLGVRKTERSFPPVERQMTAGFNAATTDEVSVDKAVLENMIRGVAIGLPSEEVQVTLDLSGVGKQAVIEAGTTNSVGRRSYERAQCGRKYDTPISVPISFKHLLDTLSVFKGDSVVDLIIAQDRNLMVVQDKTPERQVYTIIPFRTAKAVEDEKKEAEAIAEARKKANAARTPVVETPELAAAAAE